MVKVFRILSTKVLGSAMQLLSVGLTALCLFGCIGPEIKKSHFDENPELLAKVYTPAIVETIKENFRINPSRYSQEYGEAMLAMMNDKSPEFAQEMAKVSDIIDGINPIEAEALESIFELISPIQFTSDFYRNLEIGTNKVLLTVTNPTSEEIIWSGKFSRDYESYGSIPDAKPVNFETSDKLDHIFEGNTNTLQWTTKLQPGDSDSILLHMDYPRDNTMVIKMDGGPLTIFKDDVKGNKKIEQDIIGGGKLVLEDANMFGISPVIYGIRDMVLYGGTYKTSSLMKALVKGYRIGHFKMDENPLENYSGAVDFIKPIWGDMTGKDWNTLEKILTEINTPDLADYWIDTKIDHIRSRRTTPPSAVFATNIGDCDDVAYLVKLALTQAGEKVFMRRAYNRPGDSHHGLIMKKYGLYHVVVDFSQGVGSENTTTYNLKTLKDADKILGYGTRFKFIETYHPKF